VNFFISIAISAFLDSKVVAASRLDTTVTVQNKSGGSVLDYVAAAILISPETELLVGFSSQSLLGEAGSIGV